MICMGLAALILAACGGGGGGGGGGGSGIDPRLARLDRYDAQRLMVLGGTGAVGMAETDPGAMPPTGYAEFEGFATIRVETAEPLVLYGDANISVTFDTSEVSGQMDRFFGTTGSGSAADYAGVLTIDGGTVGVDAANEVQFDYSGALTATGETLVFDGSAVGNFHGTPVAALSASDLDAVVMRNGNPVDATLIVVGETDGVVTAD